MVSYTCIHSFILFSIGSTVYTVILGVYFSIIDGVVPHIDE